MKLGVKLSGVLAAALSVSLAAACNQGPDVKDRVSKQLKDANLKDVNVDYDRADHVVHLKGAVDSPADKTRAAQIAERAVGTSGKIANELTVKGNDERTADDMDGKIRSQLKAMVDNDKMLQQRDINFDVNNGVVTIKGSVASADEKAKVEQMAHSTENVRQVVDTLEVGRK